MEIRQWNGVRPLVFDRITEGPPPGFEKKMKKSGGSGRREWR